MLLHTNRRHRLLYIAMAGMEVACLLPFLLLLLGYWQRASQQESFSWELATLPPRSFPELIATPPLMAFLFLWAMFLLYILLADLMNHRLLISPQRELFGLLTLLVTIGLSIRLLLYPDVNLLDWHWLSQSFAALLDFTKGVRPELALIALNFFLWLRVSLMTGRDLTFLNVGRIFRLGILTMLLGGMLLVGWLQQPPDFVQSSALLYLILFFGFGLTTVALARMDDKAIKAETSVGALLPWPRFNQLLLTVVTVLGVSWLLIPFYTPSTLRTVLGWFSPLWIFLGNILVYPFVLFVQLIGPWMDRLVAYLRTLMVEPQEQPPAEVELAGQPEQYTDVNINEFLTEWSSVRYSLILLAIVAGAVIIWVFFLRPEQRQRRDEAEEVEQDPLAWDGNLFQQGWDRLRQLADLMRRYGLGTQLLAAISVQNIYANVSRLARKRGYPRQQAQTPEAYLPQLIMAFPEHRAAMERLTETYMRVDYGGQEIDESLLAQLQTDFQTLSQDERSSHTTTFRAS